MIKNPEEFPHVTYVSPVPMPESAMGVWLNSHLEYDSWCWEHLGHTRIWAAPAGVTAKAVSVSGRLRFRKSRHQFLFELACAEYILPDPAGKLNGKLNEPH